MGGPFDETETLGAMRALAPDISIVHGCIADRKGNTMLSTLFYRLMGIQGK